MLLPLTDSLISNPARRMDLHDEYGTLVTVLAILLRTTRGAILRATCGNTIVIYRMHYFSMVNNACKEQGMSKVSHAAICTSDATVVLPRTPEVTAHIPTVPSRTPTPLCYLLPHSRP